MAIVSIELNDGGGDGRGYDVVVELGVLERLGSVVAEVARHGKAAVIVDEGVEADWGRPVAKALQGAGFETEVAVMPVSEKKKTLGTVRNLYEVLLEAQLERGSPVVAVGGGITGDVAGFVAATYLRGVPFVNVPTSLLAMVDASVGGKTGVNVPQGKNLIGAFWQPRAVVIDPNVLETLPDRQLRCGLAECVKHGVLGDEELFTWIEEKAEAILAKEPMTLAELIERNVRIKAAVVEADEREAGVRAHLNLGHTFGHAIEATNRYSGLMHGEAVSVGMIAAAKLAVARRLCSPEVEQRIGVLLERLGLPTVVELAPIDFLMRAMRLDKKVKDGKVRLVLPTRIGEVVVVDDATESEVEAAWAGVSAEGVAGS
ncbi:MAG: 3-dehydroquinate synthase [Planctomycetota bacterium]